MTEEKWYHGRLSRQRAEELVNRAGVDGSFVVRASESILGAYALSVLYGGTIHTYRILPTDNGLLAVQTINGVQQRKFTSISELITAYRSPQNGLICGLTNPVGPSPDKPALAPPPAVATPIPIHDPIRSSIPMPHTPPAQVTPPVGRGAVKVMVDDLKLTLKTKEKQRERELPPLPPPTRDAPQRPSLKPASQPSSNPKTLEIQAKVQDRAKSIVRECPSVGQSFLDSIQQYCSEGVQRDIDGVLKGSGQCVEMQKLLAKEAGQFQNELELFLQKIEVLRQLFDVQTAIRPPNNMRADRDVDLESFLTRLGDCRKAVKSLDKRTSINIKELAGMEVESMYGTGQRSLMKNSQNIPEYNFEVKFEGGLKLTRQKLRVNVDQGKLQILKGDGVVDFTYDQVLQIIKNNKSRCKLSIVFNGGKKRDYTFESSSQREAFCQVLQLMRNMHSNITEPDCISVFIGAWNMGDAMPPMDIRSWFKCEGSGRTLDPSVSEIPHDIYVIGTQETGLPEKEWLNKVMETIADVTGETFHMVAMDALWHIKIIILVKEKHKNRVSHVQTSSVKTGIANTLGNKGAVAVSFQFGGTSMCFINAHLTSGNEKCGRRNQNYHDIMRALNLGHDRFSVFDLTNRFDHLFFLGDLNYRLEMEVQEILTHIKRRDLNMLYKVDQLRREKELNKVFYGFNEEELTFQPTYRYERGTRETYSHLKIKRTGIRINVPSWCDRVLWKSYPETHNLCKAYGCCDDIMTSDHSPVFCSIEVGVRGQYVSNEGLKSGGSVIKQPATILFESVEAILKAPGKTSFYLQFHSACLAKTVKTGRNAKYDTADLGANCVRVSWDRDALPQLQPIIADREYLVDQHLMVIIRGEDDNESHAEFVLALRSMIGTSPQRFQEHLTRKGEDAGQIQGSMHVKTRDTTVTRKEKTYEFIQFGVGLRDEAPEAAIYSETNDHGPSWTASVPAQKPAALAQKPPVSAPKMSNPGQILQNVGPMIASVTSKIMGATQSWTKSPSDTRPPIPTPLQQNQAPQPPSSLYSDPDSYQRTSVPSSASESPPKNKETSPVFPARFHHPNAWQSPPMEPQFDAPSMPGNSPLRKPTPASTSPSSLDAVIAEFEAAEGLFEAMAKAEESNKPDVMPRPHVSPMRQSYEAGGGKVTGTIHGVPLDARRPGISPRLPSTAPPPVNQTKYPMVNPLVRPPIPPPPGPAPQRPPQRGKSVRVGNSAPVMTVSDMMARLGLSQYTAALTENGWDTLEFLSDVTEEDLLDCGIIVDDHRRAILDCVMHMDYIES